MLGSQQEGVSYERGTPVRQRGGHLFVDGIEFDLVQALHVLPLLASPPPPPPPRTHG